MLHVYTAAFMATPLKVAVVGCGQIADGHVSEVQKLSDARVVAVCDLEPLMAEQLAIRFAVPAHYVDYAEMLEREAPDVVHICTPPGPHVALGKAAVDAGAHLFVEKPFALTHADTVDLIDYAERAGRKVSIGHTYEYDPASVDLRKLVADGALGEVVHVDSWFGYNLDGQFGKAILGSADHWVHRLPGKLFQNNINHLLHKVTEFMDDEQPEVQAMAWRRQPTSFGDVRDELLDELRIMIRGERVSAHGTFTSCVQPVQHWARFYGTKNTAYVDYPSRTVSLAGSSGLPSAIGRLADGIVQTMALAKSNVVNVKRFAKSEFHFFAGFAALFEHFYAHIRGEAPAPISTRDIKRIAWIMDEIFRKAGMTAGGAK